MYRYISILVILFISIITQSVNAQEIMVNGGFIQEEMKLGSPIQYFLSVKYPKDYEVLFPDENHTYTPFEFESKEFFPSTYDSLSILDSAIYTINSFEIDLFQKLSLPVYLILNGDSTTIEASIDSIKFVELVAIQVTDTTSLKTNLDLLGVPLAFNTTYLYIGMGIGIALVMVIIWIFGLRFISYIKIRRIRKSFNKFIDEYDDMVNQAFKKQDQTQVEQVILHWKGYLEKLENRPYSKLTTSQLIKIKGDSRLESALKSLDKVIYGNAWSTDVVRQLESIKDITQKYYEKKIAAVKNG